MVARTIRYRSMTKISMSVKTVERFGKTKIAALHYDKFEDLQKCAGCATIEELKGD
jgi:hypothetical protein